MRTFFLIFYHFRRANIHAAVLPEGRPKQVIILPYSPSTQMDMVWTLVIDFLEIFLLLSSSMPIDTNDKLKFGGEMFPGPLF